MSGSAPNGAAYRSLTGSTAFTALHKKGIRTRSGGVVVVGAPGDSGIPRVGVVAGKRVGGAVQRNRAKRRLRASLPEMELRPHMDYVVIASNAVPGVAFGELQRWLVAGFARVHESLDKRERQSSAG